MKFRVCRTSDYFDREKPCEGAFEVVIPRIHRTNLTSLDEFLTKAAQFWPDDSRVYLNEETGRVEIDCGDEKQWRIEIKSLDDLMEFINKNGQCVVYQDDDDELPTIEIYDDYRE